jgi:hypothetical protein
LQFQIGLGCGMSYGPGASAYLWCHYLEPRACLLTIRSYQSMRPNVIVFALTLSQGEGVVILWRSCASVVNKVVIFPL